MLIFFPFLIISQLAVTASEESNQISSTELLGWIVALIAVIPPTVALFYTANKLKHDGNSKFIQTLREVETEINQLEIENDRFAAAESDIRKGWESRFLNTMERNAHLLLSKRFPNDLLEDFEVDFGYALFLVNEIDRRKTTYKRIIKLCSKKNWKVFDADNKQNQAVNNQQN
jgi:hypothetical protein